ncbi:sensor histidine kinase [Niabella ginsengisoli]|uniref:Histidine kinase n=1 Tax=Niabella ginsengisoli TaxID=522298 RepID=A0ABS9SIB0_9BACT|nr:histidine kinase [Niabella ginsengisoli]MCH5598117.1 histidine kinase [Niabella ginsengisoli]
MILGKKHYWLLQLFGWGCFFLWHIFGAWSVDRLNIPEERLIIIQRAAGFALLGLVMTHFLRIAILKMGVFNKKISVQIALILLLMLLTSFLTGIIELIVYKRLGLIIKAEKMIFNKSLLLMILNNALAWVIFFTPWSAIYFVYHYIIAAQKEQIDTLKLKSHIKELELKTIKTHINPHFIFNALNGIRAMVDENPQRARTAITELSNILRSSINIDKSETVPLTDELNIIKDYLALEQMRFEDRLVIEYEIDEKTTGQPVPPMMLQMLVENAIKHGISEEVNGGVVKLISEMDDHILVLTVENTGKLKEQQQGGGFGIKSILERLKLMYGDNADFEILQSSPNKVTARLKLPLIL